MFKVLLKVLGAILLVGTTVQSATADAGGPKEQSSDLSVHAVMLLTSPLAGGEEAWFGAVSDESRPDVAPPMTLAIIACRIDQASPTGASAAGLARSVQFGMKISSLDLSWLVTVDDSRNRQRVAPVVWPCTPLSPTQERAR
jgi:hypothetical protein